MSRRWGTVLRAMREVPETVFYATLRDPRQAANLFRWAGSMTLPSPVPERLPMMPYTATKWLDANLQPEMSVFEYGSGASTFFFARRVARVVSVEHNGHWHRAISGYLADQRIGNCDYRFVPPQPDGDGPSPRGNSEYRSSRPEHDGTNFEDYARTIDNHPDASFDLVVVDGRARVSCFGHALPKVRPGGLLLLDDTYREEYRDLGPPAPTDPIVFAGPAPYTRHVGQTKVWKLPG